MKSLLPTLLSLTLLEGEYVEVSVTKKVKRKVHRHSIK